MYIKVDGVLIIISYQYTVARFIYIHEQRLFWQTQTSSIGSSNHITDFPMFFSTTHQGKKNVPLRPTDGKCNELITTSQPSQFFELDSLIKHPIPSSKAKLIAPKKLTHMMASGRCNFIAQIENSTISCLCLRGIFEVSAERSSINTHCVGCGHLLTNHESANPSISLHSKSSFDCFHFSPMFVTPHKIIAHDLISTL